MRDHGIGIPASEQERIFERYAWGVKVVNYGGLDLGLYLSRNIAEAHGGSIRVDSQPGDLHGRAALHPQPPFCALTSSRNSCAARA